MAEGGRRIELKAVYNADDSSARVGNESAGSRHVAFGARGEGARGAGRREEGGEGLPEAAMEGEDAAARAARNREGDGTPTKTTVCDCALTTAEPALTVEL
jgi:hypothetical protein